MNHIIIYVKYSVNVLFFQTSQKFTSINLEMSYITFVNVIHRIFFLK